LNNYSAVYRYYYFSAVIITNGPQNTTVCVNQLASISCGFTGADSYLELPRWHITKKRNVGAHRLYHETFSIKYDSDIDGLEWISDPLNRNNSVLKVGPVDMADDQSTYWCSFYNAGSSVGTLTVLSELLQRLYTYVTERLCSII